MFILRFDLESAYALGGRPETEENWQTWIDEVVASVSSIVGVLKDHDAPATFFIVGKVLEHGGDRLAPILTSHPGIDIQSHSYSHLYIKSGAPEMPETLRGELGRTADLIERHFGARPIGFCAPGNFYQGLQGCKPLLKVLWDEGYRFIGTDGEGPPERPMPAAMTQPYWYAADGFPDLLEVPVTGWHCNMLFNTGGQSDNFQPQVGFPDGSILEAIPRTIDEGFAARAHEFQYAIDHGLVYAPAYHPWSIYRFDPEMVHLGWLIEMARANDVPVRNCRQLYQHCKAQR
jgi:peptidoglycan/xylan/chitin deacetylase (PgdA/CDA1 family)